MHYDFFITFLFLLIISGILVNGWHVATRGWETKLPDGTIRKDGRLLKGWYFFWNKKRDFPKYIRFDKEHTEAFMKNALGVRGEMVWLSDTKCMRVVSPLFSDLSKVLWYEREHKVALDVVATAESDKWDVAISKEEPDYVYPEWVRDMLVDCIYCFASFYGSIIFWMIHLLAIGSDFYAYMYGWANNKFLAIVLTWVAFVISLSYVNGYFFKKINK